MLFKRFDVSHTHVLIDEDVIPRPAYISVFQWVEFWERTRDEKTWQRGFEEGADAANGEIEYLEDKLTELTSEVDVIKLKAYERGWTDGNSGILDVTP